MENLTATDDAAFPSLEGQRTDAGAETSSREAVVVFSTNLPETFHLPRDPFVVPAHFERFDLSKLINQLLQQKLEAEDNGDTWHHQPFDFLVDGQIFLRTSLHEYMTSHGITAEVPLQLQYQLAVRRLREQHLPSSRDWIASLASLPRKGLLVGASYDGSCRVHHLPSLSCSAPPSGAAESKSDIVARLPSSTTLVEVSLNQGPLGAAAAFAGGAYMPSGCLQVLLGSKGGGYNVVHVWEERQQQPEDEEQPSRTEFETTEGRVPAGTNIDSHGSNGTGLVNETGSRIPGPDEVFKKRTIRGAALKAVGCQRSEITCIDVSNDGVTVASGGADGKILLWDNVPDMKAAATQQQEFHRHNGFHNANYTGYANDTSCSKAFDAESQGFSATTASGNAIPGKRKRVAEKSYLPLSVPCVRKKEPKLVLENHTDRVSDLCFPAHPLRCVLYTSALDETICGWDTLVGGAPLSVWTTSRPVTSVSCSPVDGTVVCSAHVDGRLRLWDIRSGTVAASIKDTERGAGQNSTEGPEGPHSSSSNAAHLEAGLGTGHNSHRSSGKKFPGTAHLTLNTNSRLDRRFTFGNVPDRRTTTRARWCPVKEGEYWIATVSQDGMLRLRDIRAASMPLFSVEVRGGLSDGPTRDLARSTAAGEITHRKAGEVVAKKGLPVRLLSCSWLDGHRIATGGSDGIIRVFTVGATALIEQTF